MRRISLPMAVLSLLTAVLGKTAQADGVEGSVPPLATLVVEGLETPVRVALHVRVGETPWARHFADAQTRHAKALFTQLDSNGDGALSAAEAARSPAPRNSTALIVSDRGQPFVAFNFRVLDRDGDGSGSPAELESYLRSVGDMPIRLATVPALAFADPLFQALDANFDGKLTREEADAFERLFERDADSNRVLTLDELRGRGSRRAAPEFVARAISGDAASRPLRVSLDSNPRSESASHFNVALGYHAVAKRTSVPSLEADVPPLKPGDQELKIDDAPRSLTLAWGTRRLILRVLPERPSPWSAEKTMLEQEFAGRKTGGEGVALGGEMSPRFKAMAALADRNGDRKVSPEEFQQCLERVGAAQTEVRGACLRAVVFAEEAGLLPLLDSNRDGKLSRRELSGVPALVKSLDSKGDGLSLDDVPRTTLVVFQRGPFADGPDKNLLRESGPSWFSRADRNGDGDLDREEFLGEAADFDRIDRNRDGWIDVEEAMEVELRQASGERKEAP